MSTSIAAILNSDFTKKLLNFFAIAASHFTWFRDLLKILCDASIVTNEQQMDMNNWVASFQQMISRLTLQVEGLVKESRDCMPYFPQVHEILSAARDKLQPQLVETERKIHTITLIGICDELNICGRNPSEKRFINALLRESSAQEIKVTKDKATLDKPLALEYLHILINECHIQSFKMKRKGKPLTFISATIAAINDVIEKIENSTGIQYLNLFDTLWEKCPTPGFGNGMLKKIKEGGSDYLKKAVYELVNSNLGPSLEPRLSSQIPTGDKQESKQGSKPVDENQLLLSMMSKSAVGMDMLDSYGHPTLLTRLTRNKDREQRLKEYESKLICFKEAIAQNNYKEMSHIITWLELEKAESERKYVAEKVEAEGIRKLEKEEATKREQKAERDREEAKRDREELRRAFDEAKQEAAKREEKAEIDREKAERDRAIFMQLLMRFQQSQSDKQESIQIPKVNTVSTLSEEKGNTHGTVNHPLSRVAPSLTLFPPPVNLMPPTDVSKPDNNSGLEQEKDASYSTQQGCIIC